MARFIRNNRRMLQKTATYYVMHITVAAAATFLAEHYGAPVLLFPLLLLIYLILFLLIFPEVLLVKQLYMLFPILLLPVPEKLL